MAGARIVGAAIAWLVAGAALSACRGPLGASEPEGHAESLRPAVDAEPTGKIAEVIAVRAPATALPAAATVAAIARGEPLAATPAAAAADDENPCSHAEPSATQVPGEPVGAAVGNCSMP